MINKAITDIAEIEVLPGNIYHITFLKDTKITLQSAKQLVLTIEELADQNLPYRAGMFDISSVVNLNKEAREYFSKSEDTSGRITAIALISTSNIGQGGRKTFSFDGKAKRQSNKVIPIAHTSRTLASHKNERSNDPRRVSLQGGVILIPN